MLWQVDTTKHWPKSKPKKKPHHPSSMLINNRCLPKWADAVVQLNPQPYTSKALFLFVCFVCAFKKVHLHKYKCLFLLSTRTFGKAIFLYLLWMNIKVHYAETSSFIPFPCGIPTWLLKEQAEDLALFITHLANCSYRQGCFPSGKSQMSVP